MNADASIDDRKFSLIHTTPEGHRIVLAGLAWAMAWRRALRLRARGCRDCIIRSEPRLRMLDAQREPSAEGPV